MRILHVARQFAPATGGFENHVGELVRAQGEAGHKPTVLTLDPLFANRGARLPAYERKGTYEIRRIPYFGSRLYPVLPSVFRQLAEFDVIHVHGIDFFFHALAWGRRVHGRPLVVTTDGRIFHTAFAGRLKKAFFETVTRRSLRAYGAVLACSTNDRDLFAGITERPIDLVENGVDIDKFADRASPVFRKHIISIGRFASHKRLERLLDFLAEVRAKDPGWTLALAGVEWDVKTADLARESQARGLADAVSIGAGLADAGIASEIGQASFIASASDHESSGTAIVEGMSAGLIPLMSDIPSFRCLHESAPTGQLLDFADARRAATRFVAAAGVFAENHAAFRARARDVARQYSWSATARKIDAIYDRVVGEHRRDILGAPALVVPRDDAIKRLDAESDQAQTLGIGGG